MHRHIHTDPLRNFKYRVEIQRPLDKAGNNVSPTLTSLGFMAVSGLAASTEPIAYREGGDNTTPRKMPGQTDFPPISLTRGLVGTRDQMRAMYNWFAAIFAVTQGNDGTAFGGPGPSVPDFRATVIVRVYDHPRNMGEPHVVPDGHISSTFGSVRAGWKIYNAWPSALAFSDLDAGGNGVLVNNLTLMHEGWEFAAREPDGSGGKGNLYGYPTPWV